jgi:RNA polymerase sigma factor (sigma-70 family)
MAIGNLKTVLDHLQRAGGGLSDGVLLERFVAGRDEAAFETLVHRHGPMVLGVCRRLLGNAHDAEDAFQATFFLLARKATTVLKRDALGSWLYVVAQRAAGEARALLARRHTRERQMDKMPHPPVSPAEPEDWRPILDREVAQLPEKFREPVILYHLEGWSHREVAAKLGVPEGTLSSRLRKARTLLAKRLTRSGVSLSCAALACVLAEAAALAVPAPLVSETVRVATRQLAAVAPPVALLMKGVLQTMLMTKIKFVLGMLLTVAVLAGTGLAYRAGAQVQPTDKPRVEKPRSELEALRRENELLKLNLEVVLEKVKTQEAELRALRGVEERSKSAELEKRARVSEALKRVKEAKETQAKTLESLRRAQEAATERARLNRLKAGEEAKKRASDAAVKRLEGTLKALRTAPKFEGQQQAVEALEQALRQLKAQQQPKK